MKEQRGERGHGVTIDSLIDLLAGLETTLEQVPEVVAGVPLATEQVSSWQRARAQIRHVLGRLPACAAELRRERDAAQVGENHFHLVADFTYDWEYWRAPDGRYLYVSPSCARISGYQAQEFMLDPDLFLRIVHPQDHLVVAQHLEAEPVADDEFGVEFRIVARDGQTRWIHHVCQPVYEDGTWLGWRGSNRDVTRRKQVEQEQERLLAEVERQRQLIQAVADYAPVGIAVLEAGTLRARWANPAYQLFLEEPFRSQGVAGARLQDFVPRAEESGVAAIFRQVAATGRPYVNPELEHVGFARGTTYWNWSLQRLPTPLGETEASLLLLAYEVTEQVVARREAERAAAEARQRAAELDTVLAAIPDGVLIYGPEAKVIHSNQAGRDLVRQDEAYLRKPLDERLRERRFAWPDGRPIAADEAPVVRALRGETVCNAIMSMTTGDAPLWLSLSAAPLRGQDGDIAGAVASFTDITELRRTQERLEEVNQALEIHEAQLQAQNRDLERLAADLAAERSRLRTLLEHAPVAIAVFRGPDHRFEYVNPCYKDLARVEDARVLLGRPLLDGFPAAMDAGFRATLDEVLRTGRPARRVEVEVPDVAGGPAFFTYDAVPLAEPGSETAGILAMIQDVTEQVQARRRAEEEAARLKATLNAVADGLILYDTEGRITHVNDAGQKLLRFTPAEQARPLKERSQPRFVSHDGRPLAWDDLPAVRALRGETVEQLLLGVIPRGAGQEELRWIVGNAAPLYGAGGRLRGAVMGFTEVTELFSVQKNLQSANARLAQERALLEAVVRQMPAGVFVAEAPSGRLLLGNEQATRIFRHAYLPAESTAEYDQYRGFHPDGRPLRPEEWPLARAISTGDAVLDVEIEILRGDGTRGSIVVSATPVLDDQGRVAAGVITFYDVTERKEMEHALRRARDELQLLADKLEIQAEQLLSQNVELALVRDDLEMRVKERTAELIDLNEMLRDQMAERLQAEANLRESESRFRQLAEHIGELFFLFEPEAGRVLYVSPVFENLWGRPAAEVYRDPRVTLQGIHPDDRDRVLAAWRADWTRLDQEFRVVRPDGTISWVRARTFAVTGEPCAAQRIAGIVEDVTLQKRAQQALVQAERLHTAGLLAASLAHEINNPLQAAIGSLDLAREALDDGQPVGPFLEITSEALARTKGVMAQMRGLYNAPREEEAQPVDLHDLLARVQSLSRRRCEISRVCVAFEPGPNVPSVVATPDTLQQVFLNLLFNAVDATAGGGEVRITTEYRPEQKRVWVHFADRGTGIMPETLQYLFEPFHSTKPDGLGLGLFISRTLIQRLRGEVEVESKVGQGTTVSVWLPA